MKPRATLITTLLLIIAPNPHAIAKEGIPLTARGTELHEKYSDQLKTLRADVVAALPSMDEAKKSRFLDVRARWDELGDANDVIRQTERKALDEKRERTHAEAMDAATALLTDLTPLISSDALDPKLMRIAILTHGTPRGLAEFAQQGPEQEKLLDRFSPMNR